MRETVCQPGTIDQDNCLNRESHLFQRHFYAGQSVRCRIRMRYLTHTSNNFTKNWKSSNPYHVGLEIDRKHILLQSCENEDIVIRVKATVPVLETPLAKPLFTLLKLKRNDIMQPNVFKDKCEYEFSNTNLVNVTVSTVCDDWKGGSRDTVEYRLTHTTTGHTFWHHGYYISFQVSVKNNTLLKCESYCDPHLTTFDRNYHWITAYGDYILYRNNKTRTEIQTRHWECNRWPAMCNCAVAAQEGDDIIVFTICQERLEAVRNNISILHIRLRSCCPLSKATSILKEKHTTWFMRYRVVLPSGTRFTVTRLSEHLNIEVEASTESKQAEGLCGNGNGNADDDFYAGRNGISTHGNANMFVESWRVKDSIENLFEKEQTKCKKVEENQKWCFCRMNQVKCKDDIFNDDPFNARYKLEPISMFVDNSTCSFARKRRSVAVEDSFQSDEFILNNRDANFFLNENNNMAPSHHKRIRRSVAVKMPEVNATKHCKQLLEDSTAGKVCQNISQSDLQSILKACISDLKVTGDHEFAASAFGVMKESCERTIFRDLSLYKNTSSGELVPPMELVKDICTNDCSNHGNCTNRTCICEKGYTSVDCSAKVDATPKLMGIYNGGLCDVRKRPCKKTDLLGKYFLNSENLTCHVQEHKVFPSKWEPKSYQVDFHGEMFDLFGVRCDLPDPPTKLTDYDSEGTPASGLWIHISNDGQLKSQQKMRFISYDSVCMSCNRTGTCTQKDDTCLINGHCFSPNQWNPKNWCQLCRPGNSTNTWTRRTDNRAPSFGLQQKKEYYALIGENLPLQLKAIDPDYRPLKYSLVSSTASSGYSMSSSGLVQVNVTSQSKFTVEVKDECNATDTITITVHVLECPCKNGGQCSPHPYHPRGSGMYSCQCPSGFNGTKCETNIDDCVAVNCGNGTCIDGVNNYTCRCNAGFKGSLCDQKIYKCTNASCYTGVQCSETAGGITCGPCPVGMSGDGKLTCTAPTTTSLPTTVPTTREAPTTTKATTTEAPTTTPMPTTKATTTKAPKTTSMPTTKATTTEAPKTTSMPTTKATTTEEKKTPTRKTTQEKNE